MSRLRKVVSLALSFSMTFPQEPVEARRHRSPVAGVARELHEAEVRGPGFRVGEAIGSGPEQQALRLVEGGRLGEVGLVEVARHHRHAAGQRQRVEVGLPEPEDDVERGGGLDRLDLLEVGAVARRRDRLVHDEGEKVNATSPAVSGRPSEKVTPSRSRKAMVRPSSPISHERAMSPSHSSVSGLRESRLSCT